MPRSADHRHQTVVLRVVDRRRLGDQHHRDVVADVVPATAAEGCRAAPRPRGSRAGPCPRGRRGSRAVRDRVSWSSVVRSVRTGDLGEQCGSRRRHTPSRSSASRLRRSSGSVFDGRRLNHHVPQSTVRPSSRSWSYAPYCSADAFDHGLRVVDLGVDLAARGVALVRLAHHRQAARPTGRPRPSPSSRRSARCRR